jgi:heme a synthase
MKNNRAVIIWLFIGFFLVFIMVIVGGITRLTGSGLSMADWKPIMGAIPPMNEAEWIAKFDLYQKTPEFVKVNSTFTLTDFKSIFWWEFIHRLLARIIGIIFIVPFVFFWIKKKFDKVLLKKVFIIFILGGLQGLLGWYMVKSGLVDKPHVSHFRLAAHLLTALSVMVYILWVIMDIVYPSRESVHVKGLKKGVWALLILIVLQITYGAFVAGLKAGFMYNTFPKMGSNWLAPEVGEGGFASLFSHGATVQFIHRTLGVILMILAPLFWVWARRQNVVGRQNRGLVFLNVSVGIQVLLGILALLYIVPVSLGVIHQAGAAVVLCAVVYLLHQTKE